MSLVCRTGRRLYALPLGQVVETMRPMPVEPMPGAPAFVVGVAIVRGVPVPVIDAGALLEQVPSRPTRLVTLRVGERRVALAVEAVVGLRSLTGAARRELPPLLGAARGGGVSSIGALDAELLVVLEAAQLVPEEMWPAIEAAKGSP